MKTAKTLLILTAMATQPLGQPALAQSAPAAQTQVAPSAGGLDFQMFRRPAIIQALYEGDMTSLRRDRIETFRYLSPIIMELSAPDLWYRIGQEIQVMLDPQLAPITNGIAMTDADLMRGMAAPTLKGVLGMFMGLASAREANVANDRFDPFGEMAAMQKGLLNGVSEAAALNADAGHEAKNLILLAQYDPDSFMQIYDGIRQFIYGF